MRAAGHDDDGIADDERTASTVGLALEGGVAGRRVAVQLHGHEDVEQLERLRSAGRVGADRRALPLGAADRREPARASRRRGCSP